MSEALQVAWEEQRDGIMHVLAGRLTPAGLAHRVDFGPGDSPSLTIQALACRMGDRITEMAHRGEL